MLCCNTNMSDLILAGFLGPQKLMVKCCKFPLPELLRTNKVFTKDQCFYLYYHKFSIKSNVLDVYKNRHGEANPQHMILWKNIENISIFIILILTPNFPHFYYMLGGNLGSLLYGDVSVIYEISFSKG